MSRLDDKQETQKQWNADPCGAVTAGDLRPGSPEFFDKVTRERYDSYAPWMRSVVPFEAQAGKRLLEIGPGLGTDHAQFARAGAQVFALDLTATHLRLTRERFAVEGLTTRLVRADAESLPFVDGSFDTVYAFGVIHHTPDMQRAIDEIYRVLRPDGAAIIGLYHRHSAFHWLNIILFRGLLLGQLFRLGHRRLLSMIEFRASESTAQPLVQVLSRGDCRRLFARFSAIRIESLHVDFLHFLPVIPASSGRGRRLLERLFRHWGWYLIVSAHR